MTHPFDADTALTPVGPERWKAAIPGSWGVGRGPNGGFVAALAARAATLAAREAAQPLRSLTVHFLAPPAPGPLELATAVERAGRSTVSVGVRLEQDGATVALALAILAAWREGEPEWHDARVPDAPPPSEGFPVTPEHPGVPVFVANYDQRWVLGGPPGSGSEPALAGGWLRLATPRPLDALALVAFSDAWAPSAWVRVREPVAAPTLDLTVHIRAPLPTPAVPDDGWVLGRFASTLAAGGLWEEDGELWSPDGTLLAQSRQLALIRRRP